MSKNKKLKEQMRMNQIDFLFGIYLVNFLEQIGVESEDTLDETMAMVMDDEKLCPRFTNYLMVQIHGLLYSEGDAEGIRELFLSKNN